jgi:hypothetical protein
VKLDSSKTEPRLSLAVKGSEKNLNAWKRKHDFFFLLSFSFQIHHVFESRVAELEQENARLLALTQTGASSSRPPEAEVISALEQLRAQLAAAEDRERELSAELAQKSLPRDTAPVKVEVIEPQSPLSRSTSAQLPHKSTASLGLMVSIRNITALVMTENPVSRFCFALFQHCSLCQLNLHFLHPLLSQGHPHHSLLPLLYQHSISIHSFPTNMTGPAILAALLSWT